MYTETPNLLPLILIPALTGLAVMLLLAGLFTLCYFLFFRSLIRTWFEERARHSAPQLNEERIIEIVRKEIRDERIRSAR